VTNLGMIETFRGDDLGVIGAAKNGSKVAGVIDKKGYRKSMPPVVFVFYIFFDFLRES